MRLTTEQIVSVTKGQVIQNGAAVFDTYGIDSRNMRSGGLFFAIAGENTDGHLFVADAVRNGAAGAVVEHPVETSAATLIQVSNSMKALQDLAAHARSTSAAKFVGITGSSGKTSTKEFTAALLSGQYEVYKSEGNLNSLTGLPLSLLSLTNSECAVLEVAMNQPGEIGVLSKILNPDVGVVLNVNPVHLGQFHSLEEIADEKCALAAGMLPGSTLVYNADDPLISQRFKKRDQNSIRYGFSNYAELKITEVQSHGVKGSRAIFIWKGNPIPIRTKLCGIGNLYNIAAASAVALILNVSADQLPARVEKLQPYKQRGILIETGEIHIYDDSYNSNPKALEITLQMVSESAGYKRRIAVLGDMLELGPEEDRFHKRAGEQVAENRFDVLITAGPLSKHMAEAARSKGVGQVFATSNSTEAAEAAASIAQAGDLFLVKGSRGIQMEVVVEKLKIKNQK